MWLFSNFFGNKQRKLDDFFSRNAVIIDVRSKAEYDSGAIPGSKHIPLQSIATNAPKIKSWDTPIICVCASGARSASATAILKSKGIETMNGGGWLSLYKKMNT